MKKLFKIILSAATVLCMTVMANTGVFAADTAVNSTNFPDANFRQYVLDNIDTDKNGSLSAEEIEAVKKIEVTEMGIKNLKGIEYFTELENLTCYDNELTSLDLSGNPKLEELWCEGNRIKTLNVTKCPQLWSLACGGNQLTKLDLSKNGYLLFLDIEENQIESLNTSHNPYLYIVGLRNNPLKSLDLSKNLRIATLDAGQTHLTQLDLTHNYVLVHAYLKGTKTTEGNEIIYDAEDYILNTLTVDRGVTVRVNPFIDVKTTDNYFEKLSWAYSYGIVTGTTDTTFSPDNSCTRAQMAVMLWRLNGKQEPRGTSSFKDISSLSANVQKAINWCYGEEIVGGYSDGTFRPNEPVTRAQMAVMLWRMCGMEDPGVTSVPFKDLAGCGPQAKKAIRWAYGKEITKGTSSTTYGPEENCLRKQLVIFLYRVNDYYWLIS